MNVLVHPNALKACDTPRLNGQWFDEKAFWYAENLDWTTGTFVALSDCGLVVGDHRCLMTLQLRKSDFDPMVHKVHATKLH